MTFPVDQTSTPRIGEQYRPQQAAFPNFTVSSNGYSGLTSTTTQSNSLHCFTFPPPQPQTISSDFLLFDDFITPPGVLGPSPPTLLSHPPQTQPPQTPPMSE